jgi:hypothetical protein
MDSSQGQPVRLTLAVGLTTLALAWYASCGHFESGGVGQQAGRPREGVVAEQGLLERIPTAPLNVAHAGLRRVEFHYVVDGEAQDLVYEERVRADGLGRFEIDLLGVKAPSMSANAFEHFQFQQKLREGFIFRYRDFSVRELELFLANYQTRVLAEEPIIVGRKCVLLDVRRVGASPETYYQVAVDPENALVLRSREYSTQTDDLLADVAFTELDLAPVFAEVLPPLPSLNATELAPADDNLAGLGFQPWKPQVLPAGFQELRSERFETGGFKWVRRVYGDGLENLFLLQRGSATDGQQDDGPQNLAPAPNLGPGAGLPTTVRVYQMGPWTVAELLDRDRNLFMLGKVSEEAVLQALQSVR